MFYHGKTKKWHKGLVTFFSPSKNKVSYGIYLHTDIFVLGGIYAMF